MTLPYPSKLACEGANKVTLEWVKKTGSKRVAEIGTYKGATSIELAKLLPKDGSLALFDFDSRLLEIRGPVEEAAKCAVTFHGNSDKVKDSYNWSLMKLLALSEPPAFDYAFIDGSHTWANDALAFLLVDRLLVPGGYVDFDDYHWTIEGSKAMQQFPLTDRWYTGEQMRTKQVALIVELLCKKMGYEEIVPQKIYRKPAADE